MKCYKCQVKINSSNYIFTVGKKAICSKCFKKKCKKHGELKALRILASK